MADSRLPRSSTDQETAPLLRDPEAENGEVNQSPTFADRVSAIAQEPLTPLTQILLILALVLLLLSSVFIGLFAGVQHKLNEERSRHHTPSHPIPTGTTTATTVVSRTETVTTSLSTVSTTTTAITVTSTVVPTSVPKPPEEKACLTPECVMLSASIISSLDVSHDPCENFYDFANGGWLAAHPLPGDKASFGNFEALAQQNKQVIQRLLESDITPAAATSADEELLKKLRGMYASCLNEERLEEIGAEPLYKFARTVRRLFNGESTDISSESGKDGISDDEKLRKGLTAAVAFLHSRDIGALFGFDVEGDVGVDPNYMVLWFNQPDLGLPSKEYYEEKSITKVYRSVLEELISTLAEEEEKATQQPSTLLQLATNEDDVPEEEYESLTVNDDSGEKNFWPPWPWPPWGGEDPDDDDGGKKPENRTQDAHKLAKKVLKFEQRIAKASLDLDILFQDPIATYNPIPLSNLTETIPQIDFPAYFSTFAPRSYPSRVIATYPAYAASLSHILNTTSSDVLEAYLVTRAAFALASNLGTNTKAWQAQRALYEALTGVTKVGERAETCVNIVESTLGFAAGRYFVNETFGGASREKGTKVITDIVQTFKDSLVNVDWMDKKSANAAAEKADAIRVKVGFPISPDTRDARSIARYYANVKIDEDNFFDNILNATVSEEIKKWARLGRMRDPETWEMFPSTVNAYFNPPANEIVFPAGILQPPFFHQSWPAYLSYGAFGQVASHELTHAFDSAGRLYNQEGKLEEWWTNATSAGFQEKQDCIVKQYSAYTIDDGKGGKIHVNGNLTSGENIGDTGLIQAHRAWKAQYASSFAEGNEYLLPGLNYTKDQLFFISFARIWARTLSPAAAVQRIRTDPHSPSRYRVDGTVSNIPEFAKAFNCSAKAKLNPPKEKQCIFWG
ncbi:hypothetical protein HGRIS_013522 [Hohenbuehelia grisea]|uniref:Endothelin-converting enzyme 1 n=1 Tax=Hohenbuehelia grisea TaxID=104357 RepID=A0ABR3IVY8_9AGAR